jgi:DNA-directed RNA polymerase subunit RPC12/RpoP
MSRLLDVTNEVGFGDNDGEWLPLDRCICGERFDKEGGCLSLGIYEDDADECPKCGRKFIFKVNINVYQVLDD